MRVCGARGRDSVQCRLAMSEGMLYKPNTITEPTHRTSLATTQQLPHNATPAQRQTPHSPDPDSAYISPIGSAPA